jgi:hypothetical protein
MKSFEINYDITPEDLKCSRGANQGEWIIATSDSSILYLASKDANPCVIVFIQGKNPTTGIEYGSVAHISVAEKIDSLNDMIDAMDIDWSNACAYLISGKSDLKSNIVQDIYALLECKIPTGKIKMDLGNKTTYAVMDLQNAKLYKATIPEENYASFDAQLYFRSAAIGIFFPERKKSLIKAFDGRCKKGHQCAAQENLLQIMLYKSQGLNRFFGV